MNERELVEWREEEEEERVGPRTHTNTHFLPHTQKGMGWDRQGLGGRERERERESVCVCV